MAKENNTPLPFGEIDSEVDSVIREKGESEMPVHINPVRMGFLLEIEPNLMDQDSSGRLADSEIISKATTDWIITQERKKVYPAEYEAKVRGDFEETLMLMRKNPALVRKYLEDKLQRNRPIPNIGPKNPPLSRNFTRVQYAAEAMDRTHDRDPEDED